MVTLTALRGIGEIQPGDNLAAVIHRAATASGVAPIKGDVLVIAQKIVSKAEGQLVDLNQVMPSAEAETLALKTGKDPRLVELILSESSAVIRAHPGILIVRHRNGYVMANAGIDSSNVCSAAGTSQVLLLPHDADRSARRLLDELAACCGHRLGIVIADSFGRPWRNGVTNVAIGAAGIAALVDRRGETDRQGRLLEVTQVATADQLAAAAGLVMGEAAEGLPVALIRGFSHGNAPERPASALVRPLTEDLFQ